MGWRHQWLHTDGMGHGIFVFVLMAMMYLWAPHKYSQRFAYSAPVEGDDQSRQVSAASNPAVIWADEHDGEDGDDFWQRTRGTPKSFMDAPKQARDVDVIGAPES